MPNCKNKIKNTAVSNLSSNTYWLSDTGFFFFTASSSSFALQSEFGTVFCVNQQLTDFSAPRYRLIFRLRKLKVDAGDATGRSTSVKCPTIEKVRFIYQTEGDCQLTLVRLIHYGCFSAMRFVACMQSLQTILAFLRTCSCSLISMFDKCSVHVRRLFSLWRR